jgi:hypothetical protein
LELDFTESSQSLLTNPNKNLLPPGHRRKQNIGFQPDWMIKQQRSAEERHKVVLMKKDHEDASTIERGSKKEGNQE